MAAFEKQVSDDKALNFKGTARIYFSHLDFPSPVRLVDPQIVKSLNRTFAIAGCLQSELDYRIPAIIKSQTIDSALEALGISAETFKATSSHQPRVLQLPDGVRLECLHGQHRILAAASALPVSDHWWTVDLYGNGLLHPLYHKPPANISLGLADKTKQRLREGYSYSVNYTDGEIFRQVRLSQIQNDSVSSDRWLARLTQSKTRDLRALLKRDILIKALDSILALRGLWGAFKLGSMDVFSTLRCDEASASCTEIYWC